MTEKYLNFSPAERLLVAVFPGCLDGAEPLSFLVATSLGEALLKTMEAAAELDIWEYRIIQHSFGINLLHGKTPKRLSREFRLTVDGVKRILEGAIAKLQSRLSWKLYQKVKSGVLDELARRIEPLLPSPPISELHFSVRCRKVMRRLNIDFIDQLVEKTASQLFDMKNFGPVALTEVREKLKERGLKLKGD